MADPMLTTYRGAAVDLINNNWADDDREMLEVVSEEAGVFRFNQGSLDSALLGSFAPGGWTAHVTAASGGAGVALLEIYAADIDTTTRLGGLSARGGVGPSLAAFGVGGTLVDPQLTLFNASSVIASNDSWQQSPDAAAIAALVLALGLLAVLPALASWTGLRQVAMVDAFYRSGSLVFGGGHVVLPLLRAETVPRGWLTFGG
jgi:hypothetical protein